MICASASGSDSGEVFPSAMTLSDAYIALGLKEGSSYEAVLDAKNRLLNKFDGQTDKRLAIETAYDVIFSQQLKARLSGDLPVSNRVRFADVGAAPKRKSSQSKRGGGFEIPGIGGNGGVALSLRQLSDQPALSTAAVFGSLAAWTLAQGFFFEAATPAADVPGLQLALGTAATVYLLREYKKVGLGKAAALAVAGLVVGTVLGNGLESWLRVDLVPLGSLSSPGVVIGEGALLGLWAVTFFLA